jgi:holo-[acyl-carrier protein] synthase
MSNDMIVGIGTDIVQIPRIQALLDKFGERFIARCFTQAERGDGSAAHLAKRFAAKEATLKALGTGFAQGISWQDIEVVKTPSGKPTLALHNAALAQLPQDAHYQLHLSLSDDYPVAQAFVVIETTALA